MPHPGSKMQICPLGKKVCVKRELAAIGIAAVLSATQVVWAAADAPTLSETPPSTEASPPAGSANCWETLWSRPDAKVQMEADGAMPMSITTVQDPLESTPAGCQAIIHIHSKSALAALMGPPVIADQRDLVSISPLAAPSAIHIEVHSEINARARYARLYGASTSIGEGVINYAGVDLREGAILGGETVNSSVTLKIYARGTDEEVGELRAPHATITIGSRRVGRRRIIETALGRKECIPITYEKRSSLGPTQLVDTLIMTTPSVMQITDWYCPSERFVLRTEVREQGKVQRIDTTAIMPVGAAP
ncbi:hypothetical protein CS8_048590 [Cupriavidus sp. 8B]